MLKFKTKMLKRAVSAVVINTTICILACLNCFGQNIDNAIALQWETSSLKLKAPPGKGDVPFAFTARNTSQTIIAVKNVTSSCGCTLVKTGTNEVKPGESLEVKGIIKADFGDDDRTSEILVQTDNAIYRLNVLLEKELPVKIVPRLVLWHLLESNEPKIIKIRVSAQQHLRLEKIDADENAVDVRIGEVSPEGEYQLVVSPKNTSKLGVYPLMIHVLDATNHPHDNVVYAAVRPHAPLTANPAEK